MPHCRHACRHRPPARWSASLSSALLRPSGRRRRQRDRRDLLEFPLAQRDTDSAKYMVLVSKVALLTADLLLPPASSNSDFSPISSHARSWSASSPASACRSASHAGRHARHLHQCGQHSHRCLELRALPYANTPVPSWLPQSRWCANLGTHRGEPQPPRSPSQHTASLSSARCLTATRARPPP